MANMFYWILHSITGCPKSGFSRAMYGANHCNSCGRVHFIGDTLPKLTRLARKEKKIRDIVLP